MRRWPARLSSTRRPHLMRVELRAGQGAGMVRGRQAQDHRGVVAVDYRFSADYACPADPCVERPPVGLWDGMIDLRLGPAIPPTPTPVSPAQHIRLDFSPGALGCRVRSRLGTMSSLSGNADRCLYSACRSPNMLRKEVGVWCLGVCTQNRPRKTLTCEDGRSTIDAEVGQDALRRAWQKKRNGEGDHDNGLVCLHPQPASRQPNGCAGSKYRDVCSSVRTTRPRSSSPPTRPAITVGFMPLIKGRNALCKQHTQLQSPPPHHLPIPFPTCQ